MAYDHTRVEIIHGFRPRAQLMREVSNHAICDDVDRVVEPDFCSAADGFWPVLSEYQAYTRGTLDVLRGFDPVDG